MSKNQVTIAPAERAPLPSPPQAVPNSDQFVSVLDNPPGEPPFLSGGRIEKVPGAADPPKAEGIRIRGRYALDEKIETYDEEQTFNLIVELRGCIRQGDDTEKRIQEALAGLEASNKIVLERGTLEEMSEAKASAIAAAQGRIPLFEERIAALKEKKVLVQYRLAGAVNALREQLFLMGDLIHHGNAAMADGPETPAMGPWIGSPANTFAFTCLEQDHYRLRHSDLYPEDIFALARSVVADAEAFFSELTRLENAFNGEIPIRLRGEAGGFVGGKGGVKFFDLKLTSPVRFFVINPEENTFGAAGSTTLPCGIWVHPDHVHEHYGPKDFPDDEADAAPAPGGDAQRGTVKNYGA
jgi:hypothetical protein